MFIREQTNLAVHGQKDRVIDAFKEMAANEDQFLYFVLMYGC